MVLCRAFTSKGVPCKYRTRQGAEFCFRHRHQNPADKCHFTGCKEEPSIEMINGKSCVEHQYANKIPNATECIICSVKGETQCRHWLIMKMSGEQLYKKVIDSRGNVCHMEWTVNGKFHNKDGGPSLYRFDDKSYTTEYYYHGALHRLYEPAYYGPGVVAYYYFGRQVSPGDTKMVIRSTERGIQLVKIIRQKVRAMKKQIAFKTLKGKVGNDMARYVCSFM
jgi:hypothetical protein